MYYNDTMTPPPPKIHFPVAEPKPSFYTYLIWSNGSLTIAKYIHPFDPYIYGQYYFYPSPSRRAPVSGNSVYHQHYYPDSTSGPHCRVTVPNPAPVTSKCTWGEHKNFSSHCRDTTTAPTYFQSFRDCSPFKPKHPTTQIFTPRRPRRPHKKRHANTIKVTPDMQRSVETSLPSIVYPTAPFLRRKRHRTSYTNKSPPIHSPSPDRTQHIGTKT